jgi:hypothetical protein
MRVADVCRYAAQLQLQNIAVQEQPTAARSFRGPSRTQDAQQPSNQLLAWLVA